MKGTDMPESTEFDLKLASGTVHAHRWGSPDAPLALCVHGLSANAHAFDYLAERIAGSSRQMVAFDLRGRGRSEITPPGSYGLTAHAQDALEAATVLGADRFDYVGWSLGALIGSLIGRALWGGPGYTAGWITSILGAMLLLWAYRAIVGRTGGRTRPAV